MTDNANPFEREALPSIPSMEDMAQLQKKATYILSVFEDHPKLGAITKREDGFYDVEFEEDVFGTTTKSMAVLDLNFPFTEEGISSVVAKYTKRPDRELFLSIGPGNVDYPKKYTDDKNVGTKRAFVITDTAYGIARVEENLNSLRLPSQSYCIGSDEIQGLPDESYLYNKIDYSGLPGDSFDTIQIANTLSDPNAYGIHLSDLVRVLKSGTGELVVITTNTPENYTLQDLKQDAGELNCQVDVLYGLEKDSTYTDRLENDRGKAIPKQLRNILREKYHATFGFLAPGSYVAIVRKNKKGIVTQGL